MKLRQDVDRITKEYATVEDMEALISEVRQRSIQNKPSRINTVRGACLLNSFECSIGPTGMFPLSHDNQLPISNSNDEVFLENSTAQHQSENSPSKSTSESLSADCEVGSELYAMTQPPAPLPLTPCSPSLSHLQCLQNELIVTRSFATAATNSAEEPHARRDRTGLLCKQSFANISKAGGKWQQNQVSDEWKQVQRKRHRNRFTGNKGKATVNKENKFRAADRNIPIYIYNVSKETSENDIMSHIKSRTNINVTLIKWNMKQNKDYIAFKIFVPENKIDTFLSEDFWPVGVAFRRFITFRRKSNREGPNQNLL